MKTKKLCILVMFIALLCNANGLFAQDTWKEFKKFTAELRPVTNSASWTATTIEKLYNNCIIAIHLSGYELDPQKTESGKASNLIVTNPLKYNIPFAKTGAAIYSLSILVYTTAENKIFINIQVDGAKVQSSNKTPNSNKSAKAWLNNKISEDVDKFINHLETIEGKSSSITTAKINIE